MCSFFAFNLWKMILISLIWIPTVLCQFKVVGKELNCDDIKVLNEQDFVKEVVILNMLDDASFDIDCIYKKYSENWQVVLLDDQEEISKKNGKRYYNLMMKKNISFAMLLPKPDSKIIRNSHLFNLFRRIPKAIVEIFFFNISLSDNLQEFEEFANDLLFELEIIHFVGIVPSHEISYIAYDVNSDTADPHIDILTSFNSFNYTDIVNKSYKLRKKSELIITIFHRFPSCLIKAQNDTKLNLLMGSHGFAGKDSLIIDVLVQALGVRASYSIPPGVEPFGSVMENGTVTGTLKEIVDGTADISANPRFITSYGVDDDIEFLGYNHIDNLCVVIPKAEIVPLWVQVVQTYTLNIWGLILLQTITITLLRWLHYKLIMERWMSPTNLFIDTACSYIAPIQSLRISHQKLVLCSISLICIIVVPVIQGSIRSVFTRRKYHPDLNTLEDVDKNYKVLYAPAMDRKLLFEKGDNKVYDSLYDKLDNSPIFLNDLIEMMLVNSGMGVISPLTDFKSALIEHPQELAHKFHIVQECPREYLYASICSVHFPWKEELTMLTLRLVASGLPVWYHEFTMALLSSRSFVNAPPPLSMATRPLEINHLDGPFWLLTIGVIISIIIFVFEVFYGKPRLKKNE